MKEKGTLEAKEEGIREIDKWMKEGVGACRWVVLLHGRYTACLI
jgi:hypothetical protein